MTKEEKGLIIDELTVKFEENSNFYVTDASGLTSCIEEIMDSEEKYLNAYDKNPIITDLKYFLKIFKNIFFNNARSN